MPKVLNGCISALWDHDRDAPDDVLLAGGAHTSALLRLFQKHLFLLQCPKPGVLGRVHAVPKPPYFWAGSALMIYGYIRTSRAAVDGLAGMDPETQVQVQALAGTGVEPDHIVSDVGISGSVPVIDRPGWTGLDARLLRGDTVTVAALDRISRNRVELVAVVELLHRRGVGIASLSPSESWLHPLGAPPPRSSR